MRCFGGEDGNPLPHQFREAAERFQMIDDAQTPVLVPYGERGRSLLKQLVEMPERPGRLFDRDAQRYVVGVWDHVLRKMREHHLDSALTRVSSGTVRGTCWAFSRTTLTPHGRWHASNPFVSDTSVSRLHYGATRPRIAASESWVTRSAVSTCLRSALLHRQDIDTSRRTASAEPLYPQAPAGTDPAQGKPHQVLPGCVSYGKAGHAS